MNDGFMSDEERSWHAMGSSGRRFELVFAAYTKWVLAKCPMSAEMRLRMLEGLNNCLSPSALAALQPCCSTAAEMVHEALALDQGGERLSRSWDVLTGQDVFKALLQLNPSMRTAAVIYQFGPQKEAA